MEISMHPSAHKHGMDAETITALWPEWIEQRLLDDDSPGRVLRVCLDDAGRAFELIAVVFDGKRALVIHAMQLRPSTIEQMRSSR